MPKYYEVRCTEFTAGLIDEEEEAQAKGFGKRLSNKDNVMLMCFLRGVVFLLKVFQKIVDIVPETKTLIAKVGKLRDDKFLQSYDEENGTFFGTRELSAIKVEVLQSLRNFMETKGSKSMIAHFFICKVYCK